MKYNIGDVVKVAVPTQSEFVGVISGVSVGKNSIKYKVGRQYFVENNIRSLRVKE